MSGLADFLRERKGDIVRPVDVLIQGDYDHTLGEYRNGIDTIDVIEFDALLDAIDDFEETFK